MYIYFKGVAILLRALIEKVGEEEDARGFVEGVGRVSGPFFLLRYFSFSFFYFSLSNKLQKEGNSATE